MTPKPVACAKYLDLDLYRNVHTNAKLLEQNLAWAYTFCETITPQVALEVVLVMIWIHDAVLNNPYFVPIPKPKNDAARGWSEGSLGDAGLDLCNSSAITP